MTDTTNPTTPAIPAVRNEAQRKTATRVRSENFGGPRLKLQVNGSIPGFHLYWANDDEGSVEQLLQEGFEFVQSKEVAMQSHIVADADLGDRVSRYVGRKEDGTPMRAFLLKCTEEDWADRASYRAKQADERDAAIRNGRIQPDAGRYTPKGLTIGIDTEFKKSY